LFNLKLVESYLALLDTGSYHGAASQLGLAQSTVSQHIRKLEKAIGTTLVIRSRNGCTMAPQTEAFSRYAKALVRIAHKAWDALRLPMMTVGASSNIGTYLLQPIFKDFYEANRESLKMDMIIDRNDRIADLLENDEIDVAVMEWWDNRAGFVCETWRTETLVVMVHPDHPWGSRKFIQAEELINERMVGGEPATGTGTLLRKVLGDLVSDIKVELTLGGTEAVKKAVQAGLGISIVFSNSVVDEIKNGRLKAIPIDGLQIKKELKIIHRRGLPSDSAMIRFADKLRLENATAAAGV
jgi:DNA-binding transcriptional LysR family regulator